MSTPRKSRQLILPLEKSPIFGWQTRLSHNAKGLRARVLRVSMQTAGAILHQETMMFRSALPGSRNICDLIQELEDPDGGLPRHVLISSENSNTYGGLHTHQRSYSTRIISRKRFIRKTTTQPTAHDISSRSCLI